MPRAAMAVAGDGIAAVGLVASSDDEVVVSTSRGVINRIRAADIGVCGRTARGAKLIHLDVDDTVVSVAVVGGGSEAAE